MLRRRGLAFGRLGRGLRQPRRLDELHGLGHEFVVQWVPGRVHDQSCTAVVRYDVAHIDAALFRAVGIAQSSVDHVHVRVLDVFVLVPCGPVVTRELLFPPQIPPRTDDLR